MSGGDGAGLVRAAALAAFCVALVAGCGESEEGRATGGAGALYQYRLAAEKYREGDFDAAIDIYERSLQMNPKLAEAHLDLGIIHDDYRGAKEKAVEHYRAFLAIEPRSAKAEMVRRWIRAIEEGRSASAGDGAAPPSAASEGGGAPPRPGQERLREDLAIMRAENEAYLKTVEALRGELTQVRGELAASRDAASAEEGAATTAAGWETEKRDIWRRYRGEKERFERELETLREELAHLKAQKASGDDALRKAHLRIEEAEKAAPSAGKEALPAELEAARERLRETEARVAAGAKEREALVSRLQNAEKRLQWYRLQASSESPLLLSKVKADAERERQELRKVYEKKIADVAAGFDRERAELQRELVAARRAAAKSPAPPPPPAASKAGADAERLKAEMKEAYERKFAELQGASVREKADLQKELLEARRETAYLKAEAEKARASAGQSEQYTSDAMERLREQFRREKAEMEERFRKERESILARTAAPGASASSSAAVRPSPAPPAPPAQRTAARVGKRAPAPRRTAPPARRTSAPAPARRYRTVKGDTLRSIAQRFYGSPGRWESINDVNQNTLQGWKPSAPLPAGWILLIP